MLATTKLAKFGIFLSVVALVLTIQRLSSDTSAIHLSIPRPESWSHKTSYSSETFKQQPEVADTNENSSNAEPETVSDGPRVLVDSQDITASEIQRYANAILHLNQSTASSLKCPGEQSHHPRYQVLQSNATSGSDIKYFFALDLYQVIEILPRLLGTIVQATKFLGPQNCGISIVEGRSTDGTYLVLDELREHLSVLGVRYWLVQSDIDPLVKGGDRVKELAKLRNLAVEPMLNEKPAFSPQPLLMFINDIAPCPDDIFESFYQHQLQGATQTCAMDWIENGRNFYDVWVSRAMSGNTFWQIPQDGSWSFSHNLFFDDPVSKDKYNRRVPLQVFSCWGGMTVIDGQLFMNKSIRFRNSVQGECYGGEPMLLGSDLAKMGRSRVQTLPQVNVGYSNHEGQQVKDLRKYVHEIVNVTHQVSNFVDDTVTERIKWKPPPPRYRCMPDFPDHWWVDTWYDPNKEPD